MLTSATPAKAFFIGAGIITVSVKAWVLTLAAISVIGSAGLEQGTNIVTYVVFVILARGGNLLIIGLAAVLRGRSRSVPDRMQRWLQDNNRPIMIVVGLGFGIWFGIKALLGFGIL